MVNINIWDGVPKGQTHCSAALICGRKMTFRTPLPGNYRLTYNRKKGFNYCLMDIFHGCSLASFNLYLLQSYNCVFLCRLYFPVFVTALPGT